MFQKVNDEVVKRNTPLYAMTERDVYSKSDNTIN